MKSSKFSQIINELSKLTYHQLSMLRDRVDSTIHAEQVPLLIDNTKQEDVIGCPHCGSTAVGKWGMASGLQRYKCKEELCGKTFNALTKTPLARLRKRNLWEAQLLCLNDSITVRQSARRLGVAKTTAFRWRHRFLMASAANKVSEVSGIIEADEMFFAESYKGKRTINDREPRKRGGLADKRTKEDQVAVLIVKDRSGATTDYMLGRPNKEKIGLALKPIVAPDSILCSDGAHSYRSFAKENNLTHYRTITSKGERVIGKQFHIQNVNNYMSRLRSWMERFNGVGTDYLPNYLGWMRIMDVLKEDQEFNLKDFISDAFSFEYHKNALLE
jgi:transposase-like protein